MTDEMIVALAKNGGVIQINWGSGFLTAAANEYSTTMRASRKAWLKEHGYAEDGAEAEQYGRDYQETGAVPLCHVGGNRGSF